jgi:hypothetical protein
MNEITALDKLEEALAQLRQEKPEDRSELARRYAVTITELEKVLAYFVVFAVEKRYE